MSKDWVQDITDMHAHYRLNDAVQKMDAKTLVKFLDFRINFLKEELRETDEATCPDDVIDGLIDLCVVAIGTLESFGADAYDAWDRVLEKNMAKKVGIKEGRPNPLGLPDLMKPAGWTPPDHTGNRSLFDHVFLDKWINKSL